MSMLPIDPKQMPHGMQFDLPSPKPQAGMFGGGGKVGNLISNFILNYAAANGNQGAAYTLQSMNQDRLQQARQKYEEQQYQRQRQDGLADYEAKQKIDMQYPTAPQPTEYERLLAATGIQPGTPEYQEHVGRYVGAKENPIVMTPYGPMPYSSVMGGGQQQVKPVGKLTPINGGPTPQASGGFPSGGY